MCGIAGIFNLSGSNPIPYINLEKMSACLRHRGPDQSGIYMDNQIGIAQTRLSIIDLAGGLQPIHNENNSLWIVFNGEIYNYIELKSSILTNDHNFYTNTDTEVIVHLYENEKENCLHKLNGQFAFAIWDSVNKELFIARDRVGKKPLFYTVYDGKFYFGSEIKSIFTCPEIQKEIDHNSLDQIFTFWTTLPGKTIFRNIYELPAGSYLKISKGSLQVKQYWDFDFKINNEPADYSAGEIAEMAGELLKDSTV